MSSIRQITKQPAPDSELGGIVAGVAGRIGKALDREVTPDQVVLDAVRYCERSWWDVYEGRLAGDGDWRVTIEVPGPGRRPLVRLMDGPNGDTRGA